MPRRHILSARQRSALLDLPSDEASLLRHYLLADDDLVHIDRRRRPENRIGFALQLCALRYPGRMLAPGEIIPLAVSAFLGAQLGIAGDTLARYAVRRQTRQQHMEVLRRTYGYRTFPGQGAPAGEAAWSQDGANQCPQPASAAVALSGRRPRQPLPDPLTEICEWARKLTDLSDGQKPIKGEMWFAVTDQPVFAVAGFWRQVGDQSYLDMVTCDLNELVAPIHPKAMITILAPAEHDRWLTGGYGDVLALQRPYPDARMTVRGPVFPTREAVTTLL